MCSLFSGWAWCQEELKNPPAGICTGLFNDGKLGWRQKLPGY